MTAKDDRMKRICLALLLTLLPVAATAQSVAFGGMNADRNAPVEVSADALSVDQSTGRASFTGKVVIAQGEMRLAADNVAVQYAQGDRTRIDSLVASGHVTLVSGQDAAESAQANYDVTSGRVILTGDVLLTQGQNVMAGERLEVDLNRGTAQMSGRVRTVLQPGSN